MATAERTLAEGLAMLFQDNIWKLHELLKSVKLDRKPQFVVKLTMELNKILGIEIRLLIAFHLQIDRYIEKGEDRKNNRICRKNENDLGRNRNNIKKAYKDIKRQVDRRRKKVEI